MQGLNLTYEVLATTRNEAAIDVLLSALTDGSADTRRRALIALLARSEPRAAEQVLANWELLQADDLRVLGPKKKWFAPAIKKQFVEENGNLPRAIEAARVLQLPAVIPDLVTLAESSGSGQIRQMATNAVVEMVEPIGRDARLDRDKPTMRRPVLSRLADSVRRFSMHKNEQLVDAFLLVVTWGDAEFRQLIGESSPQLELICNRLESSTLPGIDDLIAGSLRRRKVPGRVVEIFHDRDHCVFRDAILRTIGTQPTATILRNMAEIGVPVSCLGGESLFKEIIPEYRAALGYLYTAADTDNLQKLNVLAAMVESNGPNCVSAAAACFARCEVPDSDVWMRAAIAIADGDGDLGLNVGNGTLLKRLIPLLHHSDAALARSVRRILRPLHADEMLHRFDSLRPRTRRKLGRVITQVDPEALERIRDALRHPVLNKRLAAIAAADALAVVDQLTDAFAHISREDHQEARMKAAKTMAQAESIATLSLLREMVDMPESPVRDVAIESLRIRESMLPHTVDEEKKHDVAAH